MAASYKRPCNYSGGRGSRRFLHCRFTVPTTCRASGSVTSTVRLTMHPCSLRGYGRRRRRAADLMKHLLGRSRLETCRPAATARRLTPRRRHRSQRGNINTIIARRRVAGRQAIVRQLRDATRFRLLPACGLIVTQPLHQWQQQQQRHFEVNTL